MIFLRPYFLLLLFVPIFFWWWRRHRGNTATPWKKYVSAELLPYVTLSAETDKVLKKRYVPFLLTILWSLCVLALSGPAIDKLPTPAIDDAPATVIIADLNSLNDEKTNLLRVKLYELAERLQESAVALVLYDSKGYTALPLTRDIDVFKALIPSLKPQVMPAVENKLEKGVEQAIRLLKNTGKKTGRILIVTGGTPELGQSEKLITDNHYQVGVLGLGSETNGTPVIRQNGVFLRDALGNLILVKPDKNVLSRLGVYRSTTPLGKEIDELLTQTKSGEILDSFTKNDMSNILTQPDVWQDLGAYLVLLCLPLMAFLFRKGLFYVLFIMSFNTIMMTSAQADFWFRPDQISYKTVKKGNEAYNRGDYQSALKLYEQDDSEEALYNKGNALAHLKEYYKAVEAYESVLKKNPKHADALFNKTYLEQFLKQEQQKSQSQKNNENQNHASDEQDSDNQKNDKSNSLSDEQDNQSDNSDNSTQSDKQENPSDKADSQDNSNSETQSQSENETNSDGSEDSADKEREKSNQNEGNDTSANNISSDLTDKKNSDKNDKTQNNNMQTNVYNQESSDNSDEQEGNEQSQISETEETMDSDKSDSHISVASNGLASDETDQETQQIINRLKKDPSQVLKFRLQKQYLAQ